MTQWFSILFPAWKLFDRPGDSYRIFVQTSDSSPHFEWAELIRPPRRRKWREIFFNPNDLHWLYFHSLMNELSLRITEKSFEEAQLFFQQALEAHLCFLFEIESPKNLKILLRTEDGQMTHQFISDIDPARPEKWHLRKIPPLNKQEPQ